VAGALADQIQASYFPVSLRDLRSRIHFTELEEGVFRVGETLVETQYLNHTAPTLAYRISSGGETIAYVSDHEPYWRSNGSSFQHPGDQRHIAFLNGADLVIHDAQYSEEEYPTKIGWGHSTVEYATDVAMAAGVGRLALFHHDPAHDDAEVTRLEAAARARVAEHGAALQVFAAAEGLALEVRGRGFTSPSAGVSALQNRPIAGRGVLVVSADELEVTSIGQTLAEDNLVLLPTPDTQTALAWTAAVSPDLAIIDGQLPDGSGATLIRRLRDRLGQPILPIILLTEDPGMAGTLSSEEAAHTDYLAKPWSPPMLRARVRAWLARSPVAARTQVGDAGGVGPATTAGASALLASLPLFRSLTRDQLHGLVARATERVYPAGHVLIRQGEPPDNLFVVLSGRVRVVETAPDSPLVELLLGELGRGEVFGEMGILCDRPRSATVVTLERTHCLVLPNADFLRALHSAPELAVALLRVLAERLYQADRLAARYRGLPVAVQRGIREADQYLHRKNA
jgi:CRP-like cAMP-binding protein/CheY-like chemotaxis protein